MPAELNLEAILQGVRGLSVLVVGDIVLDRWAMYDPAAAQPSLETGIPRVGVVAVECTPGAGGTVANNLKAFGVGRVAVLGIVGEDGSAFDLRAALAARAIEKDMLIAAPGFQTFTYTKLLNLTTGAEDRARVDFINLHPPPPGAVLQLREMLHYLWHSFDVILVADQAETEAGGVITEEVRETLAKLAATTPRKVVWVDSRRRLDRYRNAILKPNEQEAREVEERLFGAVDHAGLRRHVEAPLLVVTHGPRGALIVDEKGEQWISTRPVENPVDICGAGDSFSAGAACALALTGSAAQAVQFGNLVASVTIMKRGTGTATPEELRAARESV